MQVLQLHEELPRHLRSPLWHRQRSIKYEVHRTCLRIETTRNGYFPVYCREHIELKIEDARKRIKILREAGDIEKATHFLKLANLLSGQLKNLENAVAKCKLEEELIQKISIEARKNVQGGDHISLSELEDSFSSQQSN